jgi:hypothetical protein
MRRAAAIGVLVALDSVPSLYIAMAQVALVKDLLAGAVTAVNAGSRFRVTAGGSRCRKVREA